MAARINGGLSGLLERIARQEPGGLLAQGLTAEAHVEPEKGRETPSGSVLAGGIVDALRAMPGALELIRDEVRELVLLEHPERHRLALIAQVVRESCRRYGVPVARGCDWSHAVRMLYPAGSRGDWVAEANLAAQERGLHPLWRWDREHPLLTEDEEWLAQVLLAGLRAGCAVA